MANQAPLQTLADLLRGSSAKLLIEPSRFAPSTVYDLEYRLVVVACAFDLHSKAALVKIRRIQAVRLKLMQFVAVRPWLFPVVQDWAASQKSHSCTCSHHRVCAEDFSATRCTIKSSTIWWHMMHFGEKRLFWSRVLMARSWRTSLLQRTRPTSLWRNGTPCKTC